MDKEFSNSIYYNSNWDNQNSDRYDQTFLIRPFSIKNFFLAYASIKIHTWTYFKLIHLMRTKYFMLKIYDLRRDKKLDNDASAAAAPSPIDFNFNRVLCDLFFRFHNMPSNYKRYGHYNLYLIFHESRSHTSCILTARFCIARRSVS